MNLYNFLLLQEKKPLSEAMSAVCQHNDAKYYRKMGMVDMCDELINILSEETLKTEIKTRCDAIINKGDEK